MKDLHAVVDEVYELIEVHGSDIIEGIECLKLSSSVLAYLNFGFTKILEQDAFSGNNVIHADMLYKLKYIQNYILNTRKVKITNTEDCDKCINLTVFHKIKYLHLKNTPFKMVTGLQGLKDRIETLIWHEAPDSEMLNHFDTTWSSLVYADFQFNSLSVIPGCAFLNLIELDVSHNVLTDISSLLVVPCLEILNVSFNKLTNLQWLPLASKISKLNLSNNYIENITKIERCSTTLTELDLRNNLILSRLDLASLQTLTYLRSLMLTGNPCSHERRYRIFTASMLHIGNFRKSPFYLDGEVITGIEYEISNTVKIIASLKNDDKEETTKFTKRTKRCREVNIEEQSEVTMFESLAVSDELEVSRNCEELKDVPDNDNREEINIDGSGEKCPYLFEENSLLTLLNSIPDPSSTDPEESISGVQYPGESIYSPNSRKKGTQKTDNSENDCCGSLMGNGSVVQVTAEVHGVLEKQTDKELSNDDESSSDKSDIDVLNSCATSLSSVEVLREISNRSSEERIETSASSEEKNVRPTSSSSSESAATSVCTEYAPQSPCVETRNDTPTSLESKSVIEHSPTKVEKALTIFTKSLLSYQTKANCVSSSKASNCQEINYSFENFCKVDHRLRLFADINVFLLFVMFVILFSPYI